MAADEPDDVSMLAALAGVRSPTWHPRMRLPIGSSCFSGPMPIGRSSMDKRFFSGPFRIENSANTADSRPSNNDAFLSTMPSLSNPVRRRSQQHSHYEHLLRSGPLGKCNDPFCTTCPVYFDNDVQDYDLPLLEQKVHTNMLGRARKFFTDAQSWGMPLVCGVMNPHTKRVQQWNKVFLISCLLAVFVDPLFFFILSVNQNYNCIYFNLTLAKVITILRSITDLVYVFHMLLQFRLAYIGPHVGSGTLEDNPKRIAWHYLNGWFFIDLIVVLPLPQIMMWLIVPKIDKSTYGAKFTKDILRVTVLLQNVPRMIRFFGLLAGNSSTGFIFETAWANFFINLFLFLLAAHVVGSLWYLFGLQRVNQCLHDACVNATTALCRRGFLDCGLGGNVTDRMAEIDLNLWNNWTSNENASSCFSFNSAVFTYGIYNYAVNITSETNFADKYIFSLFWGFQQISTLAGNLMPSMFIGEVLFVLGIIILGLLLTVLLIGNMQVFLQSLGRRNMDMQLKRRDVEAWMARRRLPLDIRRKVKQAEQFKWAANRGVNEELLLQSLPEDIEKEIRKALCLDLIKKVQLFTLMEQQVLDVICQRLRQRLYIEGNVILRRNYPIDKMHFFIRGKLSSIGENETPETLSSGDFCGDELITWCLENDSRQLKGKNRPIIGQHALSSRTVTCLGNVEAFSLSAEDLQEVTRLYSHVLRNPKVQGAIRYASLYWRTRAALCIQVAWRYRKRQLNRSNHGI